MYICIILCELMQNKLSEYACDAVELGYKLDFEFNMWLSYKGVQYLVEQTQVRFSH